MFLHPRWRKCDSGGRYSQHILKYRVHNALPMHVVYQATHFSCNSFKKKISKVVYCDSYDENMTEKYFLQAGIEVKKVDEQEFIYNNWINFT